MPEIQLGRHAWSTHGLSAACTAATNCGMPCGSSMKECPQPSITTVLERPCTKTWSADEEADNIAPLAACAGGGHDVGSRSWSHADLQPPVAQSLQPSMQPSGSIRSPAARSNVRPNGSGSGPPAGNSRSSFSGRPSDPSDPSLPDAAAVPSLPCLPR